MKIHEIERVEKHIELTALGGQEVTETTAEPLEKFLTQQLLDCISSPNPKLRRAAIRVSAKFTEISDSHKRRVLYRMSTQVKQVNQVTRKS